MSSERVKKLRETRLTAGFINKSIWIQPELFSEIRWILEGGKEKQLSYAESLKNIRLEIEFREKNGIPKVMPFGSRP